MEQKKQYEMKGNEEANEEGSEDIEACKSDYGEAGQDESDITVVPERCAFFHSFFYTFMHNGIKGYDFDNVKHWSRNKV